MGSTARWRYSLVFYESKSRSFDIDKLFVARYNYDENGQKVSYNSDDLDSNSEAGLQNMMLDLLIASISSPWQYSESKQPLDAVTEYVSKTILGDIDNLRGSNKLWNIKKDVNNIFYY